MDRGLTVGSKKIERGQLRAGDHIYAWRKCAAKIYSHHGIYESDEKIIHFNNNGVVICSLDRFLEGDELRLFAYGVPQWFYAASNLNKVQPTCTTEAEDPPETVLRRANDKDDLLAHGFGTGTYNLLVNNCMNFAFYCKTGRPYYDCAARAGAVSGAAVSGAVMCARCVRPSGDGPADLDGPNGSPEAARVVVPPPPRHRSPEPAARVVVAPPAWRRLPELGRVELFPRTNFDLPGLLNPTPRLFGRQETIFGSTVRMGPFFISAGGLLSPGFLRETTPRTTSTTIL